MTVLDVMEHQRLVRESADRHISAPCSTMESNKRAPMLTHYQTRRLQLVIFITLAVVGAIAIQMIR